MRSNYRRWIIAKRSRWLRLLTCASVILGATAPSSRLAAGQPQTANAIGPRAMAQIHALLAQKRNRTAVERKMDSQLTFEIKINRGQAIANGVATLETNLRYVDSDAIAVDVSAS